MDNNNKRDYSDFFKPQDGEPNGGNHNEQSDKTEKQSYYYSYGPFKPSAGGDEPETTTASSERGTSEVEITTPRPVRPLYGYSDKEPTQPATAPQWDYSGAKKKSGSLKSYVATFLAGAVIVGSLMFVSDKYNMFGGTGTAASSNSAVSGAISKTNGSGGGNGGATTAALESVVRPDNISQIVNSASPAVVKINTYVKASNRSRSNSSSTDFFDYFFGNGQRQQQNNGNGNQRQSLGMGSGFIFDKEGYILTNEHVVDGADEIEVEVQGYSKPLTAKLLGSEYSLDLAVLKIEKQDGKDFSTLQMGSSDDANVGDWVVAIGNPYGFDHTVTVGVVSAKERPIDIPDSQGTREYQHLLQTDASINPGNSGGPLLNLQGQVIGINTAVSSQAQGIGFAIPTSTVMSVLDNLKNNVKVPIPYIGVNIQDVPEEWLKDLQLDSANGTIVASVVQGSPASKADLQPYDVITEVNGEKIKTTEEFRSKIKSMKVGDKVTLTVKRSGKTLTTAVIIGDMNK